jgi:tetratricopeptide (TPR) repeat protein
MENSPSSRINGSGSDGGLTDAGIEAIKRGDKAQARRLLAQALKRDPNNPRAWLWLSGAVETEADRRHCLQRVLQIDPHNRAAQRGLEQLQALPEASSPAPALGEAAPKPQPAQAETRDLATSELQAPHVATSPNPSELQRKTGPLEANPAPSTPITAKLTADPAPQLEAAQPTATVWPPPEAPAKAEPASPIVWPPPEDGAEPEKPSDLAELRPKRDWKALWQQAQERLLALKQGQFKKPDFKKLPFLQKLPPINKKVKRFLHPIFLAYVAFGVVIVIAFGVAISNFVSQMMEERAFEQRVALQAKVEVTPTLDHFTVARTATAQARNATAEARATERAQAPTSTATPAQQQLSSARTGQSLDELSPQYTPRISDDLLEDLSDEIMEARAFARNQQYDEALEIYNQLIEDNPEDVTAYYYRGRLFNSTKDHSAAIEDFNKAIELMPTFAQAYYGRCSAQMFIGDYTIALPDCQKAIELKDDYPDAYVDLGVIYMQMQQYDNALDAFNTALALDENHAYAHLDRGYLYARLGENEQAVEDFTKAMELDESIDAYCARGSVRFYAGDYEGAVSDCTEAISRNPDQIAPYYNRARSYAAMGDYERALQDYSKIIVMNDQSANAYLQRGMIFEYLGRADQALDDYARAEQLYQADGNSYGSNVVQQLIQRLKHQLDV